MGVRILQAFATCGAALLVSCSQPFSLSITSPLTISKNPGAGVITIPSPDPGASPLPPDILVGKGTTSDPKLFGKSGCNLPYGNTFNARPANPTEVYFAESDILLGYDSEGLVFHIYYEDEHAIALGVKQVTVKNADGTQSVTQYPVSPLTASPDILSAPQVGTLALTGDQAGTDTSSCSASANCGRPIAPVLFITDTTLAASSTAGDWQMGGSPVPPSEIRGTWKSVSRTVDYTRSPALATMSLDRDPTPNNSSLGGGLSSPAFGRSVFQGVPLSEGFDSRISWDLNALGLKSGHNYRLQFMVHDGDQNASGGDAGQACVNIRIQ